MRFIIAVLLFAGLSHASPNALKSRSNSEILDKIDNKVAAIEAATLIARDNFRNRNFAFSCLQVGKIAEIMEDTVDGLDPLISELQDRITKASYIKGAIDPQAPAFKIGYKVISSLQTPRYFGPNLGLCYENDDRSRNMSNELFGFELDHFQQVLTSIEDYKTNLTNLRNEKTFIK